MLVGSGKLSDFSPIIGLVTQNGRARRVVSRYYIAYDKLHSLFKLVIGFKLYKFV